MNYIYSTLTSNVAYTLYKDMGGVKKRVRAVVVKGGANLCKSGDDGKFLTPKGVVTIVNDDDLKLLEQCPVFQRHCERKYLTIEKSSASVDKIVADMQDKDKSAPKTEATLPRKKKKDVDE